MLLRVATCCTMWSIALVREPCQVSRCCSVSERAAACCSVLQRVAVCFAVSTQGSTLQHAAVRYNTLQRATTRCSTLQHAATRYNTLQHATTRCNALQHAAARYNTLQRAATRCNTLHHSNGTLFANFGRCACVLFSIMQCLSCDTATAKGSFMSRRLHQSFVLLGKKAFQREIR